MTRSSLGIFLGGPPSRRLPAGSRRSQRGMTLIELLMAFAILVTGLVSIFALISAGMRSHKRAVNETEAGIVASSILSEIRADLFAGKDMKSDGTDTFLESADYPGYQYNRRLLSLDPVRGGISADLANREYFVRVTVRWSEQGENKSIGVDTIMFHNQGPKSKTGF